jgi:hypothetical protein
MRTRRGAAAARAAPIVLTAVVLAGCGGDDDAGDQTVADLCASVQAWSDISVEAVKEFRLDSPGLDPAGRRARYDDAFTELAARRDEFIEHLAELELAEPVAARLDEAVDVVGQTIADGAAEAAALPDEAYAVLAVRDGTLVTGVEKAKAVVFQALTELTEDPTTGVPRGCGRRGALDLSPPATYP